MEIKKGQIWRNVHGEVEVLGVGCGTGFGWVGVSMPGPSSKRWDEDAFLATHEFVRDPKPEIKEGGWVVSKCGGRPRQIVSVVPIGTGGNVHLLAFGINESVGISRFWHSYDPCDPPPLHKALREEAAKEPYPGHCEAERKLNHILDLYRKGER